VKIKNPEHSQMEARHDLFETRRQTRQPKRPHLELRLT
jgi:hypothetical protein